MPIPFKFPTVRGAATISLVLLLAPVAALAATCAQWTTLLPGGGSPEPDPRYSPSAIFDAPRHRMIVFGGSGPAGPKNDVWTLNLSGPATWSPIAPTGTPPAARLDHMAVFDPVRNRMLVFGGTDYTARFNDVWTLSLTGSPAWSRFGRWSCFRASPRSRTFARGSLRRR